MKQSHMVYYFNLYDETATSMVWPAAYNGNMQSYACGNIWEIDAFGEAWMRQLRLRFPEISFLFDKNEHNSFFATASYYSIVVQAPIDAGTSKRLLFMVHKGVPLAVWGTAELRPKPPGGEHFDKWYLLPDNLYANEMGLHYNEVLHWMVSDLQKKGLYFLPKETWLKKHRESEHDVRNHCIDFNDSLQTLYGYTFNIRDHFGL